MTKILVLKNGNCETDIKDIIHKIDEQAEVTILHSSRLTTESCYQFITTYSGIVILGGHQTLTKRSDPDYPYPYINRLIDYTGIWIKNNVCILGICLGAQIIGEAVGYRTKSLGYIESGYQKNIILNSNLSNDSLIQPNITKRLRYVLSHHNDYVDISGSALSPELEPTIIATMKNDSGYHIPYVFKVNESYGLQFHPEITINVLKIFCDTFFTFDRELVEFAKENLGEIKETSFLLFSNWLNFIKSKKE